jgi:hypothetical protein
LIDTNPVTFKCLVFSQWESVLELLSQAFKRNEIDHIRFNTSKDSSLAPIRFRTEPSLKVFMLNARSQCAGLTLVCATHVFLVEPSINPAIEFVLLILFDSIRRWQAMGRVHRLGQTVETWVHRYIVRDAIEEGVFALLNRRRRLNSDNERIGMKKQPQSSAASGEHVDDTDAYSLLKKELEIESTVADGSVAVALNDALPTEVVNEHEIARAFAHVAAEGRLYAQQASTTGTQPTNDNPPEVRRRGARAQRRDIIR